MINESSADTAVFTERVLDASPEAVYAAFERPEQLARWWGPDGFTNTFETFEFVPDGRWIFTMHAPNGQSYHNESFFRELEPGRRVVIEHVVAPWFRLTVTLRELDGGTHLSWHQEFETPEIAASMRELSTTANEQVLDRLGAVLGS